MVKLKNKPKSEGITSISVSLGLEKCSNPWNGDCKSTDIALYIMYRGERIPLCWDCWKTISRKNFDWETY
ncbi:MAG: hypothetical protein QXR06_02340 [Candidatus Bathyarchaeia archaeon]|nr:hypothetical protein [Candidatus Bathyarchaeota archaeon]